MIDITDTGKREKKRGAGGGSGKSFDKKEKFGKGGSHGFSASNPRGKRDSDDKRQFSH